MLLPFRLEMQDCDDDGFKNVSLTPSFMDVRPNPSFSLDNLLLLRSRFSSAGVRGTVPSWDRGVAETNCGLVSEDCRLNRRIAIA